MIKPVLFATAVLLLAGCSSVPDLPPVDDPQAVWQVRQQQLVRIQHWHLQGRIAVSNGSEAWNLDLDWEQQGEDYQIQLNGPFGAGRVKLVGNAHGVLLHDANDQLFYADHPGSLLFERTGVQVPVEGLRYWILGLASPQQQHVPELDAQGRLAYLEDDNWQVKFRRYAAVNSVHLPDKIFINKAAQDIDVRLVVDSWQLGAGTR